MYALLEKTMNEIYGITKKEVGIVDGNGLIIAFSNIEKIEKIKENFLKNFKPVSLEGQFENYYFENLNLKENEKYYIFIKGFDKESLNYLKIIKTLITKVYLKNNNSQEKKEFIKKIITQEINYKELEIDAKKYGLKINLNLLVFLIYIPNKENFKEILKKIKITLDKNKDFVVEIDFFCIAVIKKINSGFNEKNFFSFLKQIIEKINKDFDTNILISVGKIVNGLKNVKKSFEQAKTALKIKTIFKNKGCSIIKYDELGVARLVNSIPIQICEKFLNEVLKKEKIENLDKETIHTIKKFFENNLNISETSRKLFIHRNTLVYRLEKIKKLTGLDLRIFENATTFKIALMVFKYLNFIQKKKDLKI